MRPNTIVSKKLKSKLLPINGIIRDKKNIFVNLRLFEAFYRRKYKPTLNSREECSEFADLLF